MSVSPRALLENAGPRLLREVWALTGLAVLTIALRIIAKIKIRKFGSDDILMVAALVSMPFSLPTFEIN
jgi:hypothetical protein